MATDQEQFQEINTGIFFDSIKQKITAVEAALDAQDAVSKEVRVKIGQIRVKYEIRQQEINLKIGEREGGSEPLYDLSMPKAWLTE